MARQVIRADGQVIWLEDAVAETLLAAGQVTEPEAKPKARRSSRRDSED